MRAVLPIQPLMTRQTQVRLVNQCGRLQGVIRTLLPKVRSCPLAELVVHACDQIRTRLQIAVLPPMQ